MDNVRVAVIGLGGVAQLVHLPNLSKIPYVEIRSVAEVKASRLNSVADKFNIKERYKDYNELLEKSEIDAVIISTPTALHKNIAIDCLNAKKDILIEKPVAPSYNDAIVIQQTAKKNNCKVMVGMNLRFRPDTMLLKTLIQSGEIGEPFYAKSVWIRRKSSEEKWFQKREEAGGGVIMDLGISLVDLSLSLIGYPGVKSVQAQNYYQNNNQLEETSINFIRCSDSKLINIETSWALPVENDVFQLSVFGSKGNVTSSPLNLYKKINNRVVELKPSLSDSPSQLFKKSYLNELKSFVGAVKGLNPIFSSIDKAVDGMKVIDALYLSAKKNKEISIK